MSLCHMNLRKLLLIMACLVAPLSFADDLIVPVGQQGADKTSLQRPAKGQTAAAVEAAFGAPLNKSNPVGNPPISSWEYPEYRVFFEADRVIHTVLKPMSTEPDVAPAEATPAQTAPAEPAPAETVPVEGTPAAEAPTTP